MSKNRITPQVAKLKKLRHQLHQNPELSGSEEKTSLRILELFKNLQPDQILTALGGYGLAFVFNGKLPGKTVLFRCELDALPIQETNHFSYKSEFSQVSHQCGHDGHMSILAGLGMCLAQKRPKSGRVVLLYQPAEETGQGAYEVLKDPRFQTIKPDFAFALHNLPGFPLGQVILRFGSFACASKGMIIKLYGKTSHAAHPENGISPAQAMCAIIQELIQLPQSFKLLNPDVFAMCTVIYAKLGEIAFGTSPGYAEIMATLRTKLDAEMELLTPQAQSVIQSIAFQYHLKTNIEFCDHFYASFNHNQAVELICKASEQAKLQTFFIPEPFRWSEDFGFITSHYPGALFGLGAGEQCPQLHHPDYDFPDELIEIGILLFLTIIEILLEP